MDVIKTIKLGQPGTIRLKNRYGDQLIAVRYRLDKERKKYLTTVELIVDERDVLGGSLSKGKSIRHVVPKYLALQVRYQETDIRQKVKQAGGSWDSKQGVWWLKSGQVDALHLHGRVVEGFVCPDMGRYS